MSHRQYSPPLARTDTGHLIKRIAVIGNAGGGKSTLCRTLGRALDLPVHAIDHIQWQPGWTPTPAQEFTRRHAALLAQEAWIIDGWGSPEALEARFEAADMLIFVDHPLWVHYWWATKRQVMCLFRPRSDGPPGCPMVPMTWPLFQMMWRIHHQGRLEILSLLDRFRERKHVVHIRSPRELAGFASQLSDVGPPTYRSNGVIRVRVRDIPCGPASS